jgi:hypothetical protein
MNCFARRAIVPYRATDYHTTRFAANGRAEKRWGGFTTIGKTILDLHTEHCLNGTVVLENHQ